MISIVLNLAVWLAIYLITSGLKDEEWLKGFDPYSVLGVPHDASMKLIKAQYRKLSLQWHPDKNPDPNSAQMFFLINKAKEILTDPVKKENFLMYGNPEGHSGASKMTIALPTFLFDKKNQLYLLIFFAF
mmetsp:Transcript_17256/g.19977  ORF Transcript_17256/g.19977 Transcript_17256/m.19977 type:complete len:130 (+) Transcript_17256:55-444(+)